MQEIIENKKIDFKIFKKILKYAKPYTFLIISSIILLIFITALELLQPVLIGISIDRYINGYKKPYAVVTLDKTDAVKYNNLFLTKDKSIVNDPSLPKAQIIYHNDCYYLFTHLNDNELSTLTDYDFSKSIMSQNDLVINLNGRKITGIYLSKNDLKILRKNDFNRIIFFSFLFFFLIILLFTFTYLESLINQYTGQKIIFNIRLDLFKHILNLSFGFFDKNPIGRLVTRVTNDTENVNEMYTEVLANFFKNVFLIIGIVVIMLIINIKLTLLSFCVLPFVYLLIMVYRKFALKNYRILRKILSDFNAFLSEHISGLKIIQLFGIEKKIFKKYEKITNGSYKAHLTEIILFGIFRPTMFLSYIIATCSVLVFGGFDVINNLLTIGTLFIFIQYIGRFFEPVQELAEKFNIFQSAMVSAERIFNLLDEKNELIEKDIPLRINKINGHIKFNNVWFAYNDKDWVLKNVSFEINPGETMAIVGTTGAGKTSIINILSRYYDFQKGSILIDNHDIKSLSIKELRSKTGLVMQDVFIFTGSLSDNIKVKDNDITDESVREASNFVCADSFIENLENKYNHQMSERGATISTGQKQLLAFARAVVKNPDILLLDEATSNIDTETEEFIQNALKKMLKNKTSIIIAHRLSTIRNADKIIVLHHGKIIETGKHEELMRKKGFYYKLYKIQFNNA
ncbi:MAG: ABC transporter ATP-binding protein [Spirochaetes bacterium]|nr:ABC transporter ATP-binding protein [Spirochaetota bacterium]